MTTTKPPTLQINSDRLRADFEYLATIGATSGGGANRLALSNDDLAARSWFANLIEESGLLLHDDEVGNLSGVYKSAGQNAKTLLIGSHLDTVPNGGRYDGSVGVLAGLECLQTIKEAGIALPIHLEVINFTDQEGWWQSFFGSLGLTGALTPDLVNDARQDNAAFRAALFRAGILPHEVSNAGRDPDTLAGYLELHIEQGARLDRANKDIGVIMGIVGRSTYNITFYGEADHAGTTNMEDRRDALQGAAAFAILAHNLVRYEYPEGVVNCGNMQVKPGAFNVIPSQASLRMESRHSDEQQLSQMESELIRLAQDCARDHKLTVRAERVLHRPAVVMPEQMHQAVERCCQVVGASSMKLISYSGHDAQIMNGFTPAGLIFIPSVDGISHNPKEFTRWEHVEKGANVLLHTILDLAGSYDQAEDVNKEKKKSDKVSS